MVGWYLDVVVGYLIRIVIRGVRARGSSTWPVEKATVSDSRCPVAPYGGPVAAIGYTYTHEGHYFAWGSQNAFPVARVSGRLCRPIPIE
jgi:hypothetical protein